MPEDEYNSDDARQQILPPLDNDPRIADLRLATEQVARLLHLRDDEERDKLIRLEVKLAEQRRRTLPDWLEIGEGVYLLERAVMQQAGVSSPHGERYQRGWNELAPDQIRAMPQSMRSRAKWLYENREVVEAWWNGVEVEQRDRWSHIDSIKNHYAKHLRQNQIQSGDPEADPEERRRPSDLTAARRGAAAALDERIITLTEVDDRLHDTVADVELATGLRRSALRYDLSTEELAAESAENFWQIYGAEYGDDGLRSFIAALQAVIARHAEAADAMAAAAPARRRRNRQQRADEDAPETPSTTESAHRRDIRLARNAARPLGWRISGNRRGGVTLLDADGNIVASDLTPEEAIQRCRAQRED